MHSPTRAIAWQLWARHRVWIISGLAYFLLAAICCHALPHTPPYLNIRQAIAFPLILVPLGLMIIFVFGTNVDVAARESTFPSKMFTLPVRTSLLVLWPMVFGTLTMILSSVAISWLVLRPSGINLPLWWPSFFVAILLVWLQAVAWSPFPLPWVRLPLLAPIIDIQIVLIQLGYIIKLPGVFLPLILILQLPIAYGFALLGVAHARCGENPFWRLPAINFVKLMRPSAHLAGPFPSPSRAQFWLEWRLNGWSLPFGVALSSLFLAALILVFRYNVSMREGNFMRSPLTLLLLPLLLSGTASAFGKFIAFRKDKEPSAFLSIRPLTSAAIVMIKFKAAAMSILVSYLIIYFVTLALLILTGSYAETGRLWINLTKSTSAYHAIAAACAALVLIFLVSWRLSLSNMFIYLTGRTWIIFFYFTAIIMISLGAATLGQWVRYDKNYCLILLELLPYMIWTLAAVKIFLAVWIFTALLRRHLLDQRDIVRGLSFWLFGLVCLYVTLSWLIPQSLVSWSPLIPCAVLAVPLVSLALCPLTLAWNRHR
jgi:hypothetical protein